MLNIPKTFESNNVLDIISWSVLYNLRDATNEFTVKSLTDAELEALGITLDSFKHHPFCQKNGWYHQIRNKGRISLMNRPSLPNLQATITKDGVTTPCTLLSAICGAVGPDGNSNEYTWHTKLFPEKKRWEQLPRLDGSVEDHPNRIIYESEKSSFVLASEVVHDVTIQRKKIEAHQYQVTVTVGDTTIQCDRIIDASPNPYGWYQQYNIDLAGNSHPLSKWHSHELEMIFGWDMHSLNPMNQRQLYDANQFAYDSEWFYNVHGLTILPIDKNGNSKVMEYKALPTLDTLRVYIQPDQTSDVAYLDNHLELVGMSWPVYRDALLEQCPYLTKTIIDEAFITELKGCYGHSQSLFATRNKDSMTEVMVPGNNVLKPGWSMCTLRPRIDYSQGLSTYGINYRGLKDTFWHFANASLLSECKQDDRETIDYYRSCLNMIIYLLKSGGKMPLYKSKHSLYGKLMSSELDRLKHIVECSLMPSFVDLFVEEVLNRGHMHYTDWRLIERSNTVF